MLYREIDGEMMGQDSERCGVESCFGARKGYHAGFGLTVLTRCTTSECEFTCTVITCLVRLNNVRSMNSIPNSPFLSFNSLHLLSLNANQASNQGKAHAVDDAFLKIVV